MLTQDVTGGDILIRGGSALIMSKNFLEMNKKHIYHINDKEIQMFRIDELTRLSQEIECYTSPHVPIEIDLICQKINNITSSLIDE